MPWTLPTPRANLEGLIAIRCASSSFPIKQSVRALELLLGRYPAAQVEGASGEGLPAMPPPPIPAGLPSELLERRPDVIAAERRVAAAFNRIGEAQAATPTTHLAHGQREHDLERAVRAAGGGTTRCGAWVRAW